MSETNKNTPWWMVGTRTHTVLVQAGDEEEARRAGKAKLKAKYNHRAMLRTVRLATDQEVRDRDAHPVRKETATAERDAALLKIAQDFCGVETLLMRGRDHLDFPEVPVNGLKAALEAAYKAGQESVQK